MIVQDMILKDINQEGAGLYFNKVVLAVPGISDAYYLPLDPAVNIGVMINGDNATLEMTVDPRDVIEADGALWAEWDGSSIINPAITAFRLVVITSGTGDVRVSVRTLNTGSGIFA